MTPSDGSLTRQQAWRLLSVLFFVLIVGVGATGVGAYVGFRKADLVLRGEIAWGEVVALEPSGSGPDAPIHPRVTFKPAGNRAVTFLNPEGANPAAYQIGANVPVNFLPEAPEAGRIMSGRENWALPVILLLIGPIAAILALRGIARAARRLSRDDGRSG